MKSKVTKEVESSFPQELIEHHFKPKTKKKCEALKNAAPAFAAGESSNLSSIQWDKFKGLTEKQWERIEATLPPLLVQQKSKNQYHVHMIINTLLALGQKKKGASKHLEGPQ